MRSSGLSLAFLLATGGTGCFSFNTYTTPRTLAPGKQEVVIAPEVGFEQRERSTPEEPFATSRTRIVSGGLPTATFRRGLAGNLDMSLGLRRLFVASADLKLELLRGAVDMAVQGSVQLPLLYKQFGMAPGLDVPLLLGFNAGDHLTFLLSPGLGVAYRPKSSTDTTEVYGRLGGGVRIRLDSSVALQPEITGLYDLEQKQTHFTGGLGVVFNP